MSEQTVSNEQFNFPGQTDFYRGKVRDVYYFGEHMAIVVTDRISAFDHILPEPIPYKGQILNRIAAHFLSQTSDIVPNWLEQVPHPNVSMGKVCNPIKLEMVVRAHLTGHAWRTYDSGLRELSGVVLPEGMSQNDPFPKPILTPATKADEGHDEDISENEILEQRIVTPEVWEKLKSFSFQLFERGQEMAQERGLILVDSKYEFGWYQHELFLIDEIHTPDSSRYFYRDSFEELQSKEMPQRHLSKEFVREWLMSQGFQGKDGQAMPEMNEEVVQMIAERYQELYRTLMGEEFEGRDISEIESSILRAL